MGKAKEIKAPSMNFSHLCDNAFLSQSGKLNIIGIFQSITLPKIPFIYPKMSCALNVNIKEDSELKLQIISDESRELLAKVEGKIGVNKEAKNPVAVGFVGDFQHIRFEKAGLHFFEVWINNELIHTLPFQVLIPKPKK